MKIITSLTFLALTFCAVFLDTAWAQPLTVTTIAGQYGNTTSRDGIGTNALFGSLGAISADKVGNLYVIDANAVRKISPNLTVTIFAGNPTFSGSSNGTNALFRNPVGIAVDKNGYIYVADRGNNAVRKISPSGVVSTLAGNNGSSGYIDATGTNAEFMNLNGIAVDSSGNVYVSDYGTYNSQTRYMIRKITADGVVSTLAGGSPGYNDGVGAAAQFDYPQGLAVDAGGTVYVADSFGIRKVAPDGTVTTWAGDNTTQGMEYELDGIGANAGFYGARAIALDRSGGAYVTDDLGETIRYIYSPAGVVSTVAGLDSQSPTNNSNDGVGSDARFLSPYGITVDTAGNVFIIDRSGATVLKGVPPSLSPIGSFSESPGVSPVRFNNPWQFTAYYTTLVSDLRLRVQSTTTPNDEGSWTDLPGNPDMTHVDANWTLNTTDVPTGTQYFRVVASAPGYFDSASGPAGPETVLGLPQLSAIDFFLLTTGGTPVRSSNPWQFLATDTDLVSGLQLRVQSTTTTNAAGSWQDLPGIHYMTNTAGGWTLDKTDVPTGVQYFRVVASASGYVDGMSSIVGPQTVLQGFDLWGYFSYATTVPYSTATPWGFAIGQPSQIPGMSLRVQSSATPDDPNSWSNLPGGGQMTRQSDGVNWGIGTTNLPIGAAVYFRVIASAQDYVDLVSALLGPFQIGPPLPVNSTTISTGGTRTVQDFLGIGGAFMNFIHVVGVTVHLIPADNTTTTQGAITLSADQGGSVDLVLKKDQTLTAPGGVNVGPKATLIVSGTVDGPVNVGIVASGAGNAISHDSASLAQDGGTAALAAQIAQNGAISHDGNSLIGQDGGGLISQDGGGLTGQAGAAVSVGSKTPLTPNPEIPAFTQPTFTGQMTVNGNYSQFPGTALIIGIAGTNTLVEGAQQFDQLVVNGQANFLGGTIVFELLDPDDQTNLANAFQPPDGATFDVVVASNIVVNALHLLGPVWGDGMFFKGGVVTLTNGMQAVRLMATHIPPQVFIQNVGYQIHLVYGTNYTGYTVESSPNLSDWSTFSTGTNVVVLSPTNASQFFRLSKP
jgi:hypothetical protein